MPYPRGGQPATHTEYGGGDGMVDPMVRADRVMDTPEASAQDAVARVWEIYATNPNALDETDPNWDPQTATIGRDKRGD